MKQNQILAYNVKHCTYTAERRDILGFPDNQGQRACKTQDILTCDSIWP